MFLEKEVVKRTRDFSEFEYDRYRNKNAHVKKKLRARRVDALRAQLKSKTCKATRRSIALHITYLISAAFYIDSAM